MAHVLSSLKTPETPVHQRASAIPFRRTTVRQQQPVKPARISMPPATDFKAALSIATAPRPQVQTPAPTAPASDWKLLFSGTTTPAVPETPPAPPPTAESVFGPNPWMSNPTYIAPDGRQHGYNKYYFASPETAAKVAQMASGTVVASNQLAAAGGFAQQQPNYMVRLPDGRLINPGIVASFYVNGYSQSYVDAMVANELRST
jgi:hypothetical protein